MMYFEMDCACKGKNLDKLLQPAILLILLNKKMHGFALIQELSESPMFLGSVPDKAGVYRYLKKMEESQLLKSSWEMDTEGNKPKRVYEITDRGRSCIKNWSQVLKQYVKSVEQLIEEIDSVLEKQEKCNG